jgi:peptidoglycan/xylan/chitin deacetylase (PgdA/CDA1 family)
MPDEPQHLARATQERRIRLGVLVVVALVVAGIGLVLQWQRDSMPHAVETRPGGDQAAAVEELHTAETLGPTERAAPLTPSSQTTISAPPVTNQPLPVEPGLAPVITRVDTDDPVVFLTIDDGLTRHAEGLAAFQRLGIPASLFLLDEPMQTDPEFFRSMPGTLVEAHTQTHRDMRRLSEAEQRQEICGNADVIEQIYGRRAVLFRPPYGNYNQATRRAAAACGMAAVVLWEENVNYDVVGFRNVPSFRPGDIILMHFRPQFVQELHVIKERVEEAGLRFALLEDYLVPETVPADLRRD